MLKGQGQRIDGEGGGEAQLIGPGQDGDVHRPGQGCAGNSQLRGPPGHADDSLAAQALAVQPALAGYDQVRVRRQTGKIRRVQQHLHPRPQPGV